MRVVCSKMFVEDINLNFKRQQNEIECEKKKVFSFVLSKNQDVEVEVKKR